MTRQKTTEQKSKSEPITLSGLDFETAVRAAMATGKPPIKRKAKKRKAQK